MTALLVLNYLPNDCDIEELMADIKVEYRGEIIAIYHNHELKELPKENTDKDMWKDDDNEPYTHEDMLHAYIDGMKMGRNLLLDEILGGSENDDCNKFN